MNRRNFFYSSAALAAPFAMNVSAAEDAADDIKLGVATYSFREFQRDRTAQSQNDQGQPRYSARDHVPAPASAERKP